MRRTRKPKPPVPSLLPHLPSVLPGLSISQEQRRLEAERVDGTACTCCGQHVRVYQRSITSSMAAWLIDLCRTTRIEGPRDAQEYTWVDVRKLPARGGDYAKLVYWKLVERKHREEEQKPERNFGLYRPTVDGMRFALRDVAVSKYVFVYNEQLIGAYGDPTTIVQALGNKFNYDDLIAGRSST